MNLADATRLVATVRACWPAMTLVEGITDAWRVVLADVEYDQAAHAVMRLARRAAPIPGAGDVRREVARVEGVLPPDEADAWQQAQAVAIREGVGFRALHPAVQQAYRAMGGAGGSLMKADTTVRAQFRDTYRQKVATLEAELLAGDLREAIRGARSRPALTAAHAEYDRMERLPDDPRALDRIKALTGDTFGADDAARREAAKREAFEAARKAQEVAP